MAKLVQVVLGLHHVHSKVRGDPAVELRWQSCLCMLGKVQLTIVALLHASGRLSQDIGGRVPLA